MSVLAPGELALCLWSARLLGPAHEHTDTRSGFTQTWLNMLAYNSMHGGSKAKQSHPGTFTFAHGPLVPLPDTN